MRIRGKLPVQLRDDLADSLGGSSGGRDDVLGGTTAISPHFTRGPVNSLLCGSDSVDCALKEQVKVIQRQIVPTM